MIQCGNSEASEKATLEKNARWISLFNGIDLDHWQVKIKGHQLGDNWNNTFKVVNGCIRVDYTGYEEFEGAYGHLFYRTPFSNYLLKFKYRFLGEQIRGGESWAIKNSGVMVHSQSPGSMERDQDFPVSVEVQLLGGIREYESRTTANVCTPGTHIYMEGELIEEHCVNSQSDTYYGEQWVDLEVEVRGDSLIRHFVNGKKVLEYNHPVYGGEFNMLKDLDGKPVKSGYIALQSESHPVEFKDIKLMPIN